MTKHKDLKVGVFKLLYPYAEPKQNDLVDDIFKYLHSQGVVIKVDRELPENPFDKSCCGLDEVAYNGFELAKLKYKRASYVAVEPLIEVR